MNQQWHGQHGHAKDDAGGRGQNIRVRGRESVCSNIRERKLGGETARQEGTNNRKKAGAKVLPQGGGAFRLLIPIAVNKRTIRVAHEEEHQQSGQKAGAA